MCTFTNCDVLAGTRRSIIIIRMSRSFEVERSRRISGDTREIRWRLRGRTSGFWQYTFQTISDFKIHALLDTVQISFNGL